MNHFDGVAMWVVYGRHTHLRTAGVHIEQIFSLFSIQAHSRFKKASSQMGKSRKTSCCCIGGCWGGAAAAAGPFAANRAASLSSLNASAFIPKCAFEAFSRLKKATDLKL